MTHKNKRFPLNLSEVVGDKKKHTTQGGQAFTPASQTATQNQANFVKPSLHAPLNTALTVTHHNTAVANQKQLNQAVKQAVNQAANPVTKHAYNPNGEYALVSDKIRQTMVTRLAQQGIKDTMVLEAMYAVPRHLFIDSGLASQAYIDASLPIGHNQTISQPYIVARMIEMVRNGLENGKLLNKVLEIGTGCGYQAAVLSLIAKEVYSIERIKALHELAKQNLRPMTIPNIRLQYGDGMLGLPQVAPFDAIILAAAGLEVPQTLYEQLAIGGRLIAPVSAQGPNHQFLQLTLRRSQHEFETALIEPCHFVPLLQGTI